jgi:hypothetical protein
MKIIIIIAALFFCFPHNMYAQIDSNAINKVATINIAESNTALVFDKKYYLQKSSSQHKTGNVLLITGASLMVGGLIVGSQINHNYDGLAVAAAGLFFGSIACLISVPFYISSHHNTTLAKALP